VCRRIIPLVVARAASVPIVLEVLLLLLLLPSLFWLFLLLLLLLLLVYRLGGEDAVGHVARA